MTVVESLPVDAALEEIAEAYGFEFVAPERKLAGGMFACPLLLRTDRGLFVRRVHSFRNTEQAFRFQAEAIDSAWRQDVPCSRVEATRSGNWSMPADDGDRVSALHRFVAGTCDDWTTWYRRKRTVGGFMHTVGRQVAELHNALAKSSPGGDSTFNIALPPIQFQHLESIRSVWRESIMNLQDQKQCSATSSRDRLLSLTGRIESQWNRLASAVRRHSLDAVPTQIVHGDISPVNMVFEAGNRVSFIDWDCVHIGLRMYDALGDVLNRPPHERPDWNRFNREEVDEYIDGYASRIDLPLTACEQRLVPAFCLARQLEDLRQRLFVLPELDAADDERYATLIDMRVEMMDQIELN